MESLRVGVVGVGGRGRAHCNDAHAAEEIELVAGCDVDADNLKAFEEKYELPAYGGHLEMLEQEDLDAVCIATPHPFHAPIALDAFAAGKHVYCDKPMAVRVSECDAMLAAADRAGKKLGIVFQRRMLPLHREIARRIRAGELGELVRANMVSAWLRTEEYFRRGARWRGTWKGEGGGVLLNQAPHFLDLYQWMAGMPVRVTALTARRFHSIETEDQASALFEYANGAHGMFTVSTVDYTGRNVFEIVGTRGAIVLDDGARFIRPQHPMDEFIRDADAEWGKMDVDVTEIEAEGENPGHLGQIRNWAQACLNGGDPIIVDGREGAKTVELFNAMILSAEKGKTVELPVDRDEYDALIEEKIASHPHISPTK